MSHDQIAVQDDLNLFRSIIDSIQDYAIVGLNDDGTIRTWHPGAERLTGYRAEEIVGRPVAVLHTEESRATGLPEEELHIAALRGSFDTEGWRARKDGSWYWASVTVTRLKQGDTSSGYVMVTQDHTDRRERDLALRAMEQMLDAITDYEVIRLDCDGTVRSWNPGAERLKQYKKDEVLGHNVAMFYTDEDVRSGLAEREISMTTQVGRFETEGWRVRKDGTQFWANVILCAIRDDQGELVGFVKVARDLTERRAQEQLLQRQSEEILELSTPVIQVWDKVLVLPIIGTLDSLRASRLTEGLLERIAEHQAEVIILEVSGVPTIDTEVAQHLLKTVEAARLMGAMSIMSGVRPEIAQAIVHLGIELGSLRSRSSLKDALQLALRLAGESVLSDRGAGDA